MLAWFAGTLAAAVAVVTWRATCSLYTPLKTRTSLSTIVGAFPGALPPVIGWAAARHAIEPGAFILFAILFLWQIPHFLAIACIYREDYARGGPAHAARARSRRGASPGGRRSPTASPCWW